MQKPSIGRIVHLCWSGTRVPAIITYVWSETCVNVRPFNGGDEETSCVLAEESSESAAMPNNMATEHRSWSWPPRVV